MKNGNDGKKHRELRMLAALWIHEVIRVSRRA
jgi:hypothetical protein